LKGASIDAIGNDAGKKIKARNDLFNPVTQTYVRHLVFRKIYQKIPKKLF
jgi:hypothetical protein